VDGVISHTTGVDRGSAVYVYLASMVAATSGLLFGFDIAVINGAIIFLRDQFHLSEIQTEFAASSLLFGCIAGASFGGWLSDRFGRRRVLMLSAVLFAFSAVLAALPRTLGEFMAARFIGGLAIGVASLLAPVYIAEVAPARNRGRLVSLNQMAIVTGILLAYLINWLLSFGGPESWRWMFASAAVPSAFLLGALFFVPESPRWLAEQSQEEEALRVLTRVNGSAAPELLREIRSSISQESGTLSELLEPGLRRALILAVSMAVLQQITGINTVLFYGSVIFKEQVGGQSDTSAIGANVVVGAVNFLATLIALWSIDRLGRRPLLMISSGVMCCCQVSLGLAFLLQPPPVLLVLGIMLACVAAFAVGLGPGTWVLLSEIFPTRVRGRAMSIATVALWIACTVLTMTFLSLANALTPTGAFCVYGAMCAITFLLVWRQLPETKGRTLEQIDEYWRHAAKGR
jgi:SP family arabinose:H+ symporter-like MFS transporter